MEVDDDEEVGPQKNTSSQDAQRSQSVTEAVAELARLAPQPYLQSLFKKVMQRLLASTQSEENESGKICTLLGLSQALVSSEALNEETISLLYRVIKPLIRTDEFEPRVQKRAYKVLFEICRHCHSFAMEEERLKELSELLVGSIMTCQVSARFMRLKCMSLIVERFDSETKQHMDIIPKVVGEVLLCLKDSNGKTREAGYQLLISMASVKEDKTEYFQIVAAALGAQTPHMRSAAVMALSRLVFEFARVDLSVPALLPPLLQTVIMLFDENSREVTKSVIGFVRVSVAAMSPEQLEPILPEVIGGLLKYGKGKDRFRSKIKIILKKLVRIYGYDQLMPLVPEGDARLLTHMRKLSERAERRKAAQKQDGRPESNDFDEMMESDEDDSDDGRTLMTGATAFTKLTARSGKSIRSAAAERGEKRSLAGSTVATSRSHGKDAGGPRLVNEKDGEVMDMLDPRMSKSVRFAEEVDEDSDPDGGAMEFDELGRLIVHDDLEDASANKNDESVDLGDNVEVGRKRRKLSKFESAKAARDEAQRNKGKKKEVQPLGAAYKSKKAGGDVKKKGQKFEPYAYMPLEGKSYTKKYRRQTVEKMATVVRSGKRKR
jgi:ribosomal RNA-processing protein 12